MSTNEETAQFKGRQKRMVLMGFEKLHGKANMPVRPHFELHTQSSLLKRRDSKQYSMTNLKVLTKSEENRVCKRRSAVTKQSNSMQALKTVLKREKDSRQAFLSFSINKLIDFQGELTKIVTQVDVIKQMGNSLVCSQDDCTSEHFSDVQQSTENSLVSMFPGGNCTSNSCDSIVNHPNVEYRLRNESQLSDESTDLRKLNVRHCVLNSRGESEDVVMDKHCFIEAEVCKHSILSNVTCRKHTSESRANKRVAIPVEDDADHSRDFDSEDTGSRKAAKQVDDTQPVANDSAMASQKKCASRTSSLSANRSANACRKPAEVDKIPPAGSAASVMRKPAEVDKIPPAGSAASVMRKPSRSTVRSTASSRNQQRSKHSSTEHTGPLDSKSTRISISKSQSKESIKENKAHLVKTKRAKDAKQRGGILNAGTLLRKRRSTTKVERLSSCDLPTTGSDKRNNANPSTSRSSLRSRSKSRSRRWQPRSVTSKNSSKRQQDIDGIKSALTCRKRSRPEVIRTLKEIINSSSNNEDAGENVSAVSTNENPLSSSRTVSPQTSAHCDKDFVENERNTMPCYRAFSKDAEVSCDLIGSTNVKVDADVLAASTNESPLSSSRTVSTQTSAYCDRNFVENECNTMPYTAFSKDAEVSCDLIGSTNVKVDADVSTIQDKPVSEDTSIHTIVGPRSVESNRSDNDSEYSDVCEGFFASEHEKTVIECGAELESISTEYTVTSTETLDTTIIEKVETNTVVSKDEVHQEEVPSKSRENRDDSMRNADNEHGKSTKRLNDYGVSVDSANDLLPTESRWTSSSLCDNDALCPNSFEVAEHHENDVRREDTSIVPESKVDIRVLNDMLMAYQCAMENARKLRLAVMIYQESLASKESGEKSEAASGDRETLALDEDQCCISGSTSFTSCSSDDRLKSQRDTECRMIVTNTEDSDGLSVCSSSSGDSARTQSLELPVFEVHQVVPSCSGVGREERNVVLVRSEKSPIKFVREKCELLLAFGRSLVHGAREKYAKIFQLVNLVENGRLQDGDKANGAVVVFEPVIEPVWMMWECLIPLICVLLILVFWCLQF